MTIFTAAGLISLVITVGVILVGIKYLCKWANN